MSMIARRTSLALLLAAAGLTLAPSAASAQAQPAAPAQPAVSAKALELLEVTSPRAEFEAQFKSGFEGSFQRELNAGGRFAAIEAAKPGIGKALHDALVTELDRAMPSEYAQYSAALARAYQQHFSEQEMEAIIGFFRSPAGQHLKANMLASAQTSAAQLGQAGKLKSTTDIPGGVQTIVNEAAVASVSKLSDEDLKAVVTFGMQPAGIKMAQSQQQMMAVQVQEATAMVNRLTPVIQPAIQKVMAEYLAQK